MGNIADGLGGRHPVLFRPCCHADAYEFNTRTELVAGSTRDPQRQKLFREARGGKPVYSDYRQMLEQEQLDIVSIATPATCHAEMVIAVAQAGVKGIYCEKAMATSLAECDKMIEACEKAGAVLAINHTRRWDDRSCALKQLVGDGGIGTLQSIQISFGGGRLCRSGSHMFDLALMFCNDTIACGCGWLGNPEDFDPGGGGFFETQRGIRLTIDGTVGMRHALKMELIGDSGVIRILEGGAEVDLWVREEESEFGHFVRRHLPMNYAIRSPMMNAVDDLVQCMEEGCPSLSSGVDGRNAFEMIAAIHQSHREDRRFITFPLDNRDFNIPSN